MTEWYPIVSEDGNIGSLLASSTEFVGIRNDQLKLYLWFDKEGYHVPELSQMKTYVTGSITIDPKKWFMVAPSIPVHTFSEIDNYVKYLLSFIKDKIEGKRMVLSYSGGKDSTAALVILLKMMNYVDFKLYVQYIHMPYLESPECVKFAENAARKLGVDLEITEPPRHLVRRYLFKEGLPFRRTRWCTYFKVRSMKDLKRRVNADIEVMGDRLTEAGKRYKRYLELAKKEAILAGKKFRPVLLMSVIDVVRVCKRVGIIHPDYLRGSPRVSCVYCPYRAVHEFRIEGSNVEDQGLIESVLKSSYRRWYAKYISYEDYVTYALWRYVPTVAKMFMKLRKDVKKNLEEREKIDLKSVIESYASIWKVDVKAPITDPAGYVKLVSESSKQE